MDQQLLRTLREQVADTLARQRREDATAGLPGMSTEDERQFARAVIARVLISLGLSAAFAAAAAPGFVFAAQAMEGGLFAVTAGASALILSALTGRAPSLSDEDW